MFEETSPYELRILQVINHQIETSRRELNHYQDREIEVPTELRRSFSKSFEEEERLYAKELDSLMRRRWDLEIEVLLKALCGDPININEFCEKTGIPRERLSKHAVLGELGEVAIAGNFLYNTKASNHLDWVGKNIQEVIGF